MQARNPIEKALSESLLSYNKKKELNILRLFVFLVGLILLVLGAVTRNMYEIIVGGIIFFTMMMARDDE